ncbi:hypothetical protein OIDMADRAFT_70823, partial [Oidiodendron maius Zn]
LLFFAALAAWCIVGLQIRNGFFQLLDSTHAVESAGWPISEATGFPAIDGHLRGMLAFFQPTVSGESTNLSLFAIYIAAQVMPMHTLVLLEGLREGNAGKIISYSTLWGILYQTVPWGIVMPLFFALHLSTSLPLADGSSRRFSIDPPKLVMLPIALTLGFVLPTALAGMPPPILTTASQQQVFLVSWQGFPIWIAVCLHTFSRIFSIIRPTALGITPLRIVYTFSIALTGFVHLIVIALAAIPSIRPFSFPQDSRSGVSLWSVFLPMSPLSSTKVKTVSEGCHILLLYDMYFACGAAILWAAVLLRHVHPNLTQSRCVVKVLLWNCLVGPGGAALSLIRERDERI